MLAARRLAATAPPLPAVAAQCHHLRHSGRRGSSSATPAAAHEQRMPDDTFDFMARLIGAPSPVGLEAAMTQGVVAPFFKDPERLRMAGGRRRWGLFGSVGGNMVRKRERPTAPHHGPPQAATRVAA